MLHHVTRVNVVGRHLHCLLHRHTYRDTRNLRWSRRTLAQIPQTNKRSSRKLQQPETKTTTERGAPGLELQETTDLARLLELTDLRQPEKWYLGARRIPRKLVLHVGPTNSGKTHHALERLKQASSGVYCGPLRLLAWEIYEKMNQAGTICNLVTGQERKLHDGASHVASTIEMVNVNDRVECAVLDEAQMLGDPSRGWAWTRALLGMQADEVHCCGDSSAVPVIQRIAETTGEEVIVYNYERLAPLKVSNKPMRSLSNVQPGDCVVVFGRKALYDVKREIEKSTGLRCGVIYGALPPTVRKEQARKFNQGNMDDDYLGQGTQVLVATDAVGMGLNLQINRMVFSTVEKFDGTERRKLSVTESKQIGGRAGRYNSSYATGTVLALNKRDAKHLSSALAEATPPVSAAGLFPTAEQLELFAMAVATPTGRKELQSDRFKGESVKGRHEKEQAAHYQSENSQYKQFLSEFYRQRENVIEGKATTKELLNLGSLIDGFSCAKTVDETTFFTGVNDLAEQVPGPYSDNDLEDVGEKDVQQCGEPVSVPKVKTSGRNVRFSQLLDLFLQCARVDSGAYFVCDCEDMVEIAKQLDSIRMPLKARFDFCLAPVDIDDALCLTALRRYAKRYSQKASVPLELKPPTLAPRTPLELRELESAHMVFDLYLWLSRRFPNEFTAVNQAQAHIQRTEQLIHEGLEDMGLKDASKGTEDLVRASIKNQKKHRNFKISQLQMPPEQLLNFFGIDSCDPYARPTKNITDSVKLAMRAHGYEYSLLSNKQKKEARKSMKTICTKFRQQQLNLVNFDLENTNSKLNEPLESSIFSEELEEPLPDDSPNESLKRTLELDDRGYLLSMMEIDWTNDDPGIYDRDSGDRYDPHHDVEGPLMDIDHKIEELREGARQARLRREGRSRPSKRKVSRQSKRV